MDKESQRAHQDKQTRQHELLASLFRELFQSERSAMRHPRIEAERLGSGPPAQAMLAVAEHAKGAFANLRAAARTNDLPVSWFGVAVGSFFSMVRNGVVDRIIDTERSYRGTLLGIRHGVDVMKLIRRVADASGHVELAGLATRWLEEREALVDRVESAMGWFAEHPVKAVATSRLRLGKRLRRAPAT